MKNTVKMITLLLAALASSTYAQRPEEKRPADPLIIYSSQGRI